MGERTEDPDTAAAIRQYEDLLDVIGVREIWERTCGTEGCGRGADCPLAAPVLRGYEYPGEPVRRLDDLKTLLLIGWREGALRGEMLPRYGGQPPASPDSL